MKNTDPVELMLVALVAIAWAAVTITRTLLVPAVALLITVAHPPEHRSKPQQAPRPAPARALAATHRGGPGRPHRGRAEGHGAGCWSAPCALPPEEG